MKLRHRPPNHSRYSNCRRLNNQRTALIVGRTNAATSFSHHTGVGGHTCPCFPSECTHACDCTSTRSFADATHSDTLKGISRCYLLTTTAERGSTLSNNYFNCEHRLLKCSFITYTLLSAFSYRPCTTLSQ